MRPRSILLLAQPLILLPMLFGGVQSSATTGVHPVPTLNDRAVPKTLVPNLANAPTDYPKPYRDGCHTQQNQSSNKASCTYGDIYSRTTVVLFGDSHALSWFPAIEKLALAKKWKLISLTMSSCWPANIPAYNSTTNQLMENCTIWRNSTFKKISKLKPEYTFVAGTAGFATVDANGDVVQGDTRTATWNTGMSSTLSKLARASKHLFYIGDYPISIKNPVDCLKSAKTVGACANPESRAVDEDWLMVESGQANASGAIFIDPTNWICLTDPCAPIEKSNGVNYVIYRDAGHLTASFAATLYRPLLREINKSLSS